ncbi:Exopolysaccharide biosynthesis protein related to N-acetylglucosamine-1-phosphodiester alpha-N-acetylglucosaminidase [Legionella spiritensis]|nr:phosphodiester glycosidase family protein [Legionella spiritensis]VEG90578.1 Exopolysaccharide biosynthesis protein related to N-acetylglucosamine-1-phosphodiester alpha-N-acetylglucosaminidase [Legionella spiritensis]
MLKQTIAPLKWLKKAWKSIFTLLMLILVLNFAVAADNWRELSPGIEYLGLSKGYLAPWSHVHAFRISLKKNRFSLVMAHDLEQDYASVDEYAQFSHALIAINGGFFDDRFHSLGLRIKNNRQLSPFKPISWWGIFYIKDGKAYLASAREFQRNPQINFAIQSGPRLLVDGHIPPLKAGRAERTALGITKDGDIVILVTDHAAMSTTELAQLMKAPPLNCVDALNLDGGNSTQLYAQFNNFHLNVHGLSKVSDAIIVQEKQ